MNKEELIAVLDKRILDLFADYFDPKIQDRYRVVCVDRIKECLYLAENMNLISFEDYDVCISIVCFIGTDYDMEERLW